MEMSTRITDKYLRKIIRTLKKSAKKHRADIRPGKRRFGIYKFLRATYRTYLELRSRRIARKATRRIAKIFKLPLRGKSHPIRILIEGSAGPEDARQKSRWSQALKFAFGWRQPAKRLKWFFKVNGGIAGSARKYADLQARRKSTKNDGGQDNIIGRQRGLGEISKLNAVSGIGSKAAAATSDR
jgi:hypothetical protein